MSICRLLVVDVENILWTSAHNYHDVSFGFQAHVVVFLAFWCVETDVARLVPGDVHEEVQWCGDRGDGYVCADAFCAFEAGAFVKLFEGEDEVFGAGPVFLYLC